MTSNTDIIRATFKGTSAENGANLKAALPPHSTWTEAAGFSYAGTYVGDYAIVENVFHRLGTEREGYKAEVHIYLQDGDRVAAFGVY